MSDGREERDRFAGERDYWDYVVEPAGWELRRWLGRRLGRFAKTAAGLFGLSLLGLYGIAIYNLLFADLTDGAHTGFLIVFALVSCLIAGAVLERIRK